MGCRSESRLDAHQVTVSVTPRCQTTASVAVCGACLNTCEGEVRLLRDERVELVQCRRGQHARGTVQQRRLLLLGTCVIG